MKKTLLKVALFIVPILFLGACAASLSNGELTVQNNNNNLQEIPMSEGKVKTYFQVKNNSTEPVRITQGQTSCMCTEATVEYKGKISAKIEMHNQAFINQEIQPGDTATVTAIFDPNAHGPNATGPISRDVFLKTNSQKTPELRLTFSGNVIK